MEFQQWELGPYQVLTRENPVSLGRINCLLTTDCWLLCTCHSPFIFLCIPSQRGIKYYKKVFHTINQFLLDDFMNFFKRFRWSQVHSLYFRMLGWHIFITFSSEVSLKSQILFAGPYENWWVCHAISFHSCRDQNWSWLRIVSDQSWILITIPTTITTTVPLSKRFLKK